jgi:hypothetical protein
MAQTSTARNSCNVKIWIDNGAGLVDISGSAASAELSPASTIGEFVVFGSTWTGRLVCGKDIPLSLEIVYSTAADEGYDIISNWWWGGDYDDPRAVRIQIPDNLAGSEQIDGNFVLENFTIPLDRGEAGPIMVSVSLLPTGEVVHYTIGS